MVNQLLKERGIETALRSTIILHGWEYLDYITPCVYGWKRQDEWLYIGSSTSGFKRLFSHDIVGKTFKVEKDDIFYLWQFPGNSMVQIMMLERELIEQLEPKYNKKHNKNYVPSEKELLNLLQSIPEKEREVELKPIVLPYSFPIPLKEPITSKMNLDYYFNSLIRVKDLPDDFPIAKGTLYNWSADKKYNNLFLLSGRTLFIDIDVFEKLVRLNKIQVEGANP